jgi:hypothetical protein
MSYRNIYFRLDTGYKWGKGLEENQTLNFYKDITSLFKESGWEVIEAKRHICPDVFKGKNHLYLHPMEASGELQEELISEVENILNKGKTFKYFHTDVYEVLQDMDDKEYQTYLESKKADIETVIMESFKTKRKNLFITDKCSILDKIKEKYRIARVQKHMGRSSDDLEWIYVYKIFENMVDSGCLMTANTKYGTGYRTA